MSKRVEPSGKYEYPVPASFVLKPPKGSFEDMEDDHWGYYGANDSLSLERQRVKMLCEEARRFGMDARAVVVKRQKLPGADWVYTSVYNWGVVTGLKEYAVDGDKIVNVRWLSPENQKDGQWAAYCVDELLVIWPGVDETDIKLMIQQNNDT